MSTVPPASIYLREDSTGNAMEGVNYQKVQNQHYALAGVWADVRQGSLLGWRKTLAGGKISSMGISNTNSRWVAGLRSILVGFGFFFLGSLSDAWLQRHTGSSLIATIDDALVGVVAGFLVFLYERRQRQNLIKKLEVIRLMNHHVRNSLQIVSFAASDPQWEASTEQIQEAVERIEWALREVLPGQRNDISDLLVPPRSEQPVAQQPKNVPSTERRK